MNTLADRIRMIRKGLGLSQAAFGREIGVSRSAINQIEEGTTKALKASTIVAIEKVSGYSGEWIESGKGAPRIRPGPLPADAEDQVSHIYAELIKLPKEYRDKIEDDINFYASLNKKPE